MQFNSLSHTIFQDIIKHSGKVYIVGGSVRDEVLGYTSHTDIDVEIHHLSYQQLQDILSQYGHVATFGKSFAIMQLDTLPGYDFALPRIEKKTGDKHQDFEVIVDPDLPIEKAILRRDLTMNALMYDYENQCIIDLVHGKEDIQNKVIKHVCEKTFVEDPLRVLRIAQFMSRFEMKVDSSTQELCKAMVEKGMLKHLSKERVYQEYCKILMSSHPSLGFYFLRDIGALPNYLQALTSTMQRLDYHPEGDVFTHTMLVVDIGALTRYKVDQPLEFMWSCLLHDIGKPLVTTKEGSAPQHNEAGVKVFKHVDLIQSKKQRQYISTMIMYHMHLMNMARHQAKDLSYLRFLKKIEGKVSLNDLIWISCCDKLGRGKVAYEQYDAFWDFIQDKMLRLGVSAYKPVVDGKMLIEHGFLPGKDFKEMLDEAYDLGLQGYSEKQIIRSLKKKYE